MRSWSASCVALLAFAASARSQSLVQLALQGEIDVSGGAHVEIEVSFVNERGDAVTTPLSFHLGERTSAADVAALLVQRLKSQGGSSLYEAEHTPPRGPAMVFLQDCIGVSTRLGRGLNGTITLCEGAPSRVRLIPAQETRAGARLSVAASTFEPHGKDRARLTLDWTFEERDDTSTIATRFVRDAIQGGWTSELTGHDTWLPGAMTNGSHVLGTSIDLRTNGDWRLEVSLARKRGER